MRTEPAGAAAGFDVAQAVADAILYEGYLLYPYRRSSGKNRVRWQFGVLVPRTWAMARGLSDESVAGSAESWWQQTECLLEAASDATARIRIRFLQLQHRSVEQRLPDGTYRPAEEIETGAGLELSFDEAVPREFDIEASVSELLAAPRTVRFGWPGGEDTEPLADGDARTAGRVLRRRWAVSAAATVSAVPCETSRGLLRLRLRAENADRGMPADATREEALRSSLLATHTLLTVRGGTFVSLLDPPPAAEPAARSCVNIHTFPVLAGPTEQSSLVLSSPILLYDHPRVAPESPGDLHDATEIDEILSLRTLTLTDAEKREARGTDARAAAIIDRVDAMAPDDMSRLHGTFRSLRAVRSVQQVAAGDEGISPETDAVVVGGTHVAKGHRVRLRPRRRGTDPQDMFLDGRTALVEAVLLDMDGSHHLAVTLEDDPGADLGRWYGRFRYFSPDEIEPLPDEREPG